MLLASLSDTAINKNIDKSSRNRGDPKHNKEASTPNGIVIAIRHTLFLI
jgi:hypothetical protein